MATPFETLKGCVPTPDSGETTKKELLMQKKTNQKTDLMTLSLVSIAQNAKTRREREYAVQMLWNIHGPMVAGIDNKNSYKEDADWDLRGLSPDERQQRILSNTFVMFRKSVLSYNPNRNDSFMAYVATNSRFQQKTVKRENAKRTNREVTVDFSGTFSREKYGDNPQTLRDMSILNKADCTTCQELEDVEIRDFFEGVGRYLKKNCPKLLQFWEACREVCEETGSYTDSDVAAKLGYTRANIGPLRRKLRNVLEEAGLDEECREVYRSFADYTDRIEEFRTVYLSRAA